VTLLLLFLAMTGTLQASEEYVILLHGLGRTARSFTKMQQALEQDHYQVVNLDYASRKLSIETIAGSALDPVVQDLEKKGAVKIHFVTHSLGGIVVRYYLSRHNLKNPGRMVMLGPPNQGSEVADYLGRSRPFSWILGKNLSRLETAMVSLVNTLPKPPLEFGIIAGDRSINGINSLFLLPGRDDGKVTVERAKLAGMKDFLVVHATHTFMMENDLVIAQVREFLRHGRFRRPGK